MLTTNPAKNLEKKRMGIFFPVENIVWYEIQFLIKNIRCFLCHKLTRENVKSVADGFIFPVVDSVTALVRSYDKWLF